jgi:hypothetical protein
MSSEARVGAIILAIIILVGLHRLDVLGPKNHMATEPNRLIQVLHRRSL